jgi:hypothetical protein
MNGRSWPLIGNSVGNHEPMQRRKAIAPPPSRISAPALAALTQRQSRAHHIYRWGARAGQGHIAMPVGILAGYISVIDFPSRAGTPAKGTPNAVEAAVRQLQAGETFRGADSPVPTLSL